MESLTNGDNVSFKIFLFVGLDGTLHSWNRIEPWKHHQKLIRKQTLVTNIL